jgi:hypothetical protein
MGDMMTNRTKCRAAKTSKKGRPTAESSEVKPPAAPVKPEYTRTPAEVALVEQQRQRRERRSPAPKMKVRHVPPEPVYIEADHPDEPLWQAKLNASMGTTERAFAKKVLSNLLETACAGSPSKAVPQEDLNAALAAMHGIGPKDEAEAMLAAQMIATHTAAMSAMRRLKGAENIPQQDSNGNLAVKLLRSYTAQLEALARYRGKGQQKVIVEHVHVHPGGQAIVGSVNTAPRPGGGDTNEIERQPHAIAHSPGEALPSAIEAHGETVPVASG